MQWVGEEWQPSTQLLQYPLHEHTPPQLQSPVLLQGSWGQQERRAGVCCLAWLLAQIFKCTKPSPLENGNST